MQLAMAKLIMKLLKSGNMKGLKMLAKQGSNKGKSVDNVINKAYKTVSGTPNSKLRPVLDNVKKGTATRNTLAPKGTFTDKFYEDGYNLTDDLGKTDWEVFDELTKLYPPNNVLNINKLTSWLGPKFKKGNLDIF